MESLIENSTSSSLKPKLQLYLIQKIKILNSSDSDSSLKNVFRLVYLIEHIVSDDDAIVDKSVSNNSSKNNKLRTDVLEDFKTHFSNYSLNKIKNEYKRSFFSICLNEILANLNTINKISNESNSETEISLQDVKSSILTIIISTNYTDSFHVIYDFCVDLKPSHHKDFCLYLMKFFLSKHCMKKLFLEKCSAHNHLSLIEDDLTKKLFNLPDKLANIYNKNLK